MDRLKIITRLFGESFKDLLPIILVIAFFQIFILQQVPEDLPSILLGLFIVAVGLTIFIQGLEIGIFPIGESLAHEFAAKGSVLWLLIFAFAIGFSTTIAEPALIAIAKKASKGDKRFLYFDKSNGGLSDARNYGMRRAAGKYFLFVDWEILLGSRLGLLHTCRTVSSVAFAKLIRYD